MKAVEPQLWIKARISTTMVWLFLDFDGVLHPGLCDTADHFCRLPILEEVLRGHPWAHVVISSSWRHSQSTDELRKLFSHDIRPRIIGVTPPAQAGVRFGRYTEISAWLEGNNRQGDPWIALDDYAYEFPKGCPNLLLCNSGTGLTDEMAAELGRGLRSLLDQ